MDQHSIWFWYNEKRERISWMTPTQYGELKPDIPYNNYQINSRLRDKTISISLSDLAGKELSSLIEEHLSYCEDSQLLRIHFANNLPREWQLLPIEWANLSGKQLYKKLQVINHATLTTDAIKIQTKQPALILNLWPCSKETQTTFSFFEQLVRQDECQVLRGSAKSSYHLNQFDITQNPLLCIIAHGNEESIKAPFQTENGQPWALPERSLPPLILLLACGSEQGNLLEYSLRLLENGAKTVLAPIGKLDASQANIFIKLFLELLYSGKPIDETLVLLKNKKELNHSAMRLRIIGTGNISLCEQSHPTTSFNTREPILSLKNKGNLIRILNQISYKCLTENHSLDEAVCTLYETVSLKYDDPHEDEKIYLILSSIYEDCWKITQGWLDPLLVHLSTLYDHGSIRKYQRKCDTHKSVQLPDNPLFYYYFAHGHYRQGNYSKAMKSLVYGLNSLDKHTFTNNEAEFKLYSKSADICVDMSLIGSAKFFLNRKKECLSTKRLPVETNDFATFCLLDQKARILVRNCAEPENDKNGQYGIRKAIGLLSKKHSLSINSYNDDGLRELSTLLYLSSWLENIPLIYYKQAYTALENIDHISRKIKKTRGNCKELYLLRALAVWAWRKEDISAQKLLEGYSDVFIELCYLDNLADSGPLGFIIAILALMKNKTALLLWPLMTSKLECDQYYYELSFLYALLQERQASSETLTKFHQQRQGVINNLKKWKKNGLSEEFHNGNFISRSTIYEKHSLEADTFKNLARNREHVDLCIEKGLLPL